MDVLAALVRMIAESERALWAINFPFGFPVEMMADGCRWAGPFDLLTQWGEDAYGAGVECLRRAKRLGGPMHVRRPTDREERTPFDAYHYRIIFQTFYGRLRGRPGPVQQPRAERPTRPVATHRLRPGRREALGQEVKALDMTLVIEGNRFSYWAKGKKDAFGRIAVDASPEPPTLVRVETDRDNDLWTWCLYELKGDTLRLCQDVKGKGRPKEFKAAADTTVVTFKRVKP